MRKPKAPQNLPWESPSVHPEVSHTTTGPTSALRSIDHVTGQVPSTGNIPLILTPLSPDVKTTPSPSIRRSLQIITGANSLLSLSVTGIAYESITTEDFQTLRYLLIVISLLQVALIVLHASLTQRWLESIRQELRLSSIPVPTLLRSSQGVLWCALECALHLIVLPPDTSITWEVEMLGKDYLLSLDSLLYLLLTVRLYHCGKLLFWLSAVSTRRGAMLLKQANLRLNSALIGRYAIAAYSLYLVFSLFLIVLAVSGVSLYLFEIGTFRPEFYTVENGIWITAQMQSTIGYGDMTPTSLFSRLTVILACVLGQSFLSILVALTGRLLTLSLAESRLYTAIAYTHRKEKYTTEAVVCIQHWWKLIRMRLHHEIDPHLVVNFYTELAVFKGILNDCQHFTDNRFEYQIQAFDTWINRHFRHRIEYLQPILPAHNLVTVT